MIEGEHVPKAQGLGEQGLKGTTPPPPPPPPPPPLPDGRQPIGPNPFPVNPGRH